ncbi:helix-turn-helix domain-containing protein [Paracidovorax cattleyae]|uniref:Helix-turn-helix domain-containing protein n=1 Tax=Paracidovorax cattleyae TaxID=80868 RepID=A0A1H0TSS6_9BURK|nr:helix-turn-helix domain-containing protein [Paracidovorax cattleyae]MBF9265560.1 helix-turn-helix transcriptional regulator [Paracidovorax cattleyae]SDP56921.1 Helix-turn-helix domain-containing protein [Paracidovorax cattleyae]
MKNYLINNVGDIGQVIRAARKAHGVRQDDLAGSAGVSHVYMRDLEHGKETVQMGRALKVLKELGVRFTLEMPDDVHERLMRDQEKAALLKAKRALFESHELSPGAIGPVRSARVERK